MLESVMFTVKGISPLIMHNGQTADPLNQYSKAIKKITAKRKKTDADYEKLSELEWYAGLYVNDDGRVIVPGDCLTAMLRDAAKKQRLGKLFSSAVFCDDDALLEYEGPKKTDKMFQSGKFTSRMLVRVTTAKVLRTRPIFKDWSTTFEVKYYPTEINIDQVKEAVETAGRVIGLGDYRPRFGRFEIVETS